MRACPYFERDSQNRLAIFGAGLRAAGYDVVPAMRDPRPGDVLVIWNRMGGSHVLARSFENRKATVLVVENAYLRPTGERWFAIAKGQHNGAGQWPMGGPERFDAWQIPLQPWTHGQEVPVVLGQRGIGSVSVRQPVGWAAQAVKKVRGRVRQHPGASSRAAAHPTLAEDLAGASCAVTWGSSAGIQALVLGVPVFHGLPSWIGAAAALPLSDWGKPPLRDDAARLAMLRRLAWAQWSEAEILAGKPFMGFR